MTGDKFFDARRMFKHACAFAGCAQFCEKEPWNIGKRLPDYTVADIVNSSFACNALYAKSLTDLDTLIELLSLKYLRISPIIIGTA